MQFVFVKGENERYGYDGLKLKGMDFAEAGVAMTCVHDIMEHFPGDEGNAEGELMALGASFYTRGKHYRWLGNAYRDDPAWHMQSEWCNILQYLEYHNERVSYRFRTIKQTSRKLEDEEAEDWVVRSAKIMVKNIHSEGLEHLNDLLGIEKWMEEVVQHNIAAYMRKGYRKARKRYQKKDTSDLAYVYYQMEKEMEQNEKWLEEGDELVVNFFYSKPYSWTMHIKSPEEEYYE